MKFQLTLLELVVVWLVGNVAQRSGGKVVGNIKDDPDGGTLTIVDIEDDNKTVYYNQNFEQGNYNYGYDVKPNGPVGQFHHENRAQDEVVYGCYGYEGPDSKNYMTFYISDAWGYRPVRQEQETEIYYPADNTGGGEGHMHGTPTKWSDLLFPEMCANMAERIASSSNLVTKAPLPPLSTPISPADRFVTAAFPSTVPASGSTGFGSRTPSVPSTSFDVIQFNRPSTIGPQPSSGRLTTSPGSSTPGQHSGIPSSGSPATGGLDRNSPAGPGSTGIGSNTPASFPSSPSPPGSTGSGSPFNGFTTGSRFSTPIGATGAPTRQGFTGAPSTAGSPSSPAGPEDVTDSESSNDGPLTPPRGSGRPGTSARPGFTSGPGNGPSSGGPSSGGPSGGPPAGQTTRVVPFTNNGQFSRLVPTPTEPSLGGSNSPSGPSGPSGSSGPSSPGGQSFSSSRLPTSRTPVSPSLNTGFSRTTSAPGNPTAPGSPSSFGGGSTPTQPDRGVSRSPPRAPSPGGSYGSSSDEDDYGGGDDNTPKHPASPSTSRVPSRGPSTAGFPSTNRNPLGSTGTTRTPSGGSSFPSQPSASNPTLPSSTSGQPGTFGSTSPFDTSFPSTQGTPRPSTGSSESNTRRQPTNAPGTTGPGVTGSRPPFNGFSSTFQNNPSTLQPSSSTQQKTPGSSSAGTPSAPFGSTAQPGQPNTSTTTGQREPTRFSSPFRQTAPPTTLHPQEPDSGSPFTQSSPPRGSPTLSTSAPRSPSTPSGSGPTSQFGFNRPSPTTRLPLRNATSPADDNDAFCSTQCSSCPSSQAPPAPPPPATPTDEEYLQIPGAMLANIPVIFYPDCSGANAYSRPAIVPFCPSQSHCSGQGSPSLTMTFPDAFVDGHNGFGPLARNAFIQQGARVTRKVRRGRHNQRLAASPLQSQ